ncbi:MAG: cyclic nucleotide-binding domain-containing protein [Rhodanobacteraceae bacterium]
MTEAVGMEKPKRWDVPFAAEVAEGEAPGVMTQASVDRLRRVEPFRSMDATRFPAGLPLNGILQNDTRLRTFRDGEVIVREGDYGHSAFLILAGKVRVILEGLDPVEIGRQKAQRLSPLQSLRRLLSNPISPESRDSRRYPQMQSSADAADGQRPLAVASPTAAVATTRVSADKLAATRSAVLVGNSGAGTFELFGELAALGRIPRATTVVADGDCALLEIRWQGLRDLRKYDTALRDWVDRIYRERGLAAMMASAPLLSGLSEDQTRQIARTAEFETFGTFDWYGSYRSMRDKGTGLSLADEPLIAEQGHYPNGLIMIRAGFARLSRRHGNGERTVSYLSRGDVYGLAELAHNASSENQMALSYSLRAIGYVDIVRVPTRSFEELILPTLPASAIPVLPADGESMERAGGEIETSFIEFLVENRFINGTATMVIDMDRCVRCDDCVRACAAGHDNNPRFVRHGRIHDHYMVANACMHCMDPVCMIGCPTGAIHRDPIRGEVVINDRTCVGCGTCANSCPYDNIRMVALRDSTRGDAIMMDAQRGEPIVKATKCDLCVSHAGGPACERACPHDALIRIDMRDKQHLAAWLER